MAGKKDFTKVNSTIEKATGTRGQQSTASQEEIEERKALLRTQGRKGAKAMRINMAFTPDNYLFIKVMSKISGKSMTEFANYVVEQYRLEHPDVFEQAKAIIDSL